LQFPKGGCRHKKSRVGRNELNGINIDYFELDFNRQPRGTSPDEVGDVDENRYFTSVGNCDRRILCLEKRDWTPLGSFTT